VKDWKAIIRGLLSRPLPASSAGVESGRPDGVRLADGLVWQARVLDSSLPQPEPEGHPAEGCTDEWGRTRGIYGPMRFWALAAAAKCPLGPYRPTQTAGQPTRPTADQLMASGSRRRWTSLHELQWGDGHRMTSSVHPVIQAAMAGKVSAFMICGAAHLALNPAEIPPAGNWCAEMALSIQPAGNFISATPADNAELLWFDELVILHGLTLLGTFVREEFLDQMIGRAVVFHLNETQPDHATHHPWGLAAFIRHPEGRPIAESMLHAVQTHFPHGPDVLSRMLLSDALWLLERDSGGIQ
jgi:hypothetical protein